MLAIVLLSFAHGQEKSAPDLIGFEAGVSFNHVLAEPGINATDLLAEDAFVDVVPPSLFVLLPVTPSLSLQLAYGQHTTIKPLNGTPVWVGYRNYYRPSEASVAAEYNWSSIGILYHFRPIRRLSPYTGFRRGNLRSTDYSTTTIKIDTRGYSYAWVGGIMLELTSIISAGVELDAYYILLETFQEEYLTNYDLEFDVLVREKLQLDLNLIIQVKV